MVVVVRVVVGKGYSSRGSCKGSSSKGSSR